jgi:hypothetical protein
LHPGAVAGAVLTLVVAGSVAVRAMAGPEGPPHPTASTPPAAVAAAVAVAPVLTADAAPGGAVVPASHPAPDTLPPLPSRVAPLRRLREPDAFVTLKRPATARQLAAARRLAFVTALTAVDTGEVRIAGRRVHALGVDPSAFRGFTPGPTAGSDALWLSLARGELTVDYGLGLRGQLLGQTRPVQQRHLSVPLRLGAFAATGLPHAGALLAHRPALQLHLRRSGGVIVSAPQADAQTLAAQLRRVFGGSSVELLGRFALDDSPSSYTGGKPRTYRQLYQVAARTCPGLSWTVLAAIGQIESNHGRDNGPSSAGALGPMQFLPSTWTTWGMDGDGDGKADIMNAYDAVYSAARYLCSYSPGYSLDALKRAIFGYNHATWYVDEVLALAVRYA